MIRPVAALLVLAGCAPPGPLEALDPPVRAAAAPGDTWLQAGKRMLAAGEPQLARDAFARSLIEEGVSAEAYTGAGIAATQRGLATEARRHFERARDLAPRSVVAHNNLGVVLVSLGDLPAARQAFQAAFALSNGSSDIAGDNLSRTEAALAAAAAAQAPDPALSHGLRRLGSGEYELIAADG